MSNPHVDALHQVRALVEHWSEDRAAGLLPTVESLSAALVCIDYALTFEANRRGPVHDTSAMVAAQRKRRQREAERKAS